MLGRAHWPLFPSDLWGDSESGKTETPSRQKDRKKNPPGRELTLRGAQDGA